MSQTAGEGETIDVAASYSRRDEAAVVPILAGLRGAGLAVWFDKNIPGGALWEETITRKLRAARAIVFFASRASLASDRCFDEISAARTLRKPIIPVVLDDVAIPDDLPDRLVLTLQTRNTVAANGRNAADVVADLVHALEALRTGAPAPAPAFAPPPPAAPAPRRSNRTPLALAAAVVAVALGGLAWYVTQYRPPPSAVAGPDPNAPFAFAATDAEWCSAPPKALLARASSNAEAAIVRAADAGDRAALDLRCLAAVRACETDAAPLPAAASACDAAAAKGSLRAGFNLGWLKQRGCGASLDADGAVAAYRASADAGCAIAQHRMAQLRLQPEILDYDAAEGLRYLKAAAAQDHPPALNQLGTLHALGREGLAEDDAKAAELYRKAADLGFAPAMFNFAYQLETGPASRRTPRPRSRTIAAAPKRPKTTSCARTPKRP